MADGCPLSGIQIVERGVQYSTAVRLTITPCAAGRETIRLARFLPAPGPPTWVQASEPAVISVSTVTATAAGQRRTLMRYRRAGPALQAIDRTDFRLTDTEFAEESRHHSRAGDNLHASPIVLPVQLTRGQWHQPLPGGRVCLAWAGTVLLTVGAHQQSTEAIALLAAEGGQRRIQWLAEGLGAIALGPPRGSLEWWMVGAACGARSWLGGITPELATLPRLPLPLTDGRRPSSRLL